MSASDHDSEMARQAGRQFTAAVLMAVADTPQLGFTERERELLREHARGLRTLNGYQGWIGTGPVDAGPETGESPGQIAASALATGQPASDNDDLNWTLASAKALYARS